MLCNNRGSLQNYLALDLQPMSTNKSRNLCDKITLDRVVLQHERIGYSRPADSGAVDTQRWPLLRVSWWSSWSETSRVPTGTENQGKPGKIGEHFPVREKSGNFVQTGKVGEFAQTTGKVLND